MSRAGGTERMTAFLANALCARHTVSILSLHGGESFFPLDAHVSHIRLPEKKRLLEIRRFLRKQNVDIVINVDTGMSIFGIPAALGLKAKVITWEHSNFYNDWNSRWFPYIRRFAARHSETVVVLTERDKQNYETNIRRCRKVIVIGNPVHPHENLYNTASKIILSAGQLSPIKRFALIPEIGKIIFPNHPDWQWRICGDGPQRAELESKIIEYGLEKNIILVGRVSDMESEYVNAAIYVMTSEMEGLPMVLLEAKSYGLPIVSYDIMTGPADIVRDGVNGYLAESGNVTAMAERILSLMDSTTLRQHFSDRAIMDMEKFDEERIIEKWEHLIDYLTPSPLYP